MQPVVESVPPMSLGARLFNVIAAPGEVFSSVAAAPFRFVNWWCPALLVGLLVSVCALILFSQPVFIQQIREVQDREMQKMVDQGKMKPADMERAQAMMAGIGLVLIKVGAVVGGVAGSLVGPAWWALIAWLVARFVFRSDIGYLRVTEVTGLASVVNGLSAVVGMFLQLGLGSLFSGPHLGTLVKGFDPTNRAHLALAVLNPFSLWHLALVALGTAQLIGSKFRPVFVVLFGVWIGYKGIAIILGLVQFAL